MFDRVKGRSMLSGLIAFVMCVVWFVAVAATVVAITTGDLVHVAGWLPILAAVLVAEVLGFTLLDHLSNQ